MPLGAGMAVEGEAESGCTVRQNRSPSLDDALTRVVVGGNGGGLSGNLRALLKAAADLHNRHDRRIPAEDAVHKLARGGWVRA